MQITVIDVGAPNTHAAKNGRSYQSMEVTYKGDNGQTASKKLMSFSNPTVFNAAKDWTKGDVVNVTTQKDDQGYWQWTGIGGNAVAQSNTPSSTNNTTPTRVAGSNYETKEERQARQVYIVRQSSIANAISALTVGAKSSPSADSILSLAKDFEAYVFNTKEADKAAVDLSDLESDIPY